MNPALSHKTVKTIESIKKDVEKNGVVAEKVVKQLKELRPLFIDVDPDPLITRVIRLTYEYIDEKGAFDLDFLSEPEVEEEELEEEREEGAEPQEEEIVVVYVDPDSDDSFTIMKDNFLFLLDLLLNNDNNANRDELQRVKHTYLELGLV